MVNERKRDWPMGGMGKTETKYRQENKHTDLTMWKDMTRRSVGNKLSCGDKKREDRKQLQDSRQIRRLRSDNNNKGEDVQVVQKTMKRHPYKEMHSHVCNER